MNDQERIQLTLGFTAKRYALMVEYAGYAWLERYFANDAELKNMFVTCTSFWKWWINEWNQRDAEFLRETSLRYINEPLTGYELQLSLHLFTETHNVKGLQIVPDKWVISEVNGLIKKHQQTVKELKANG